jgi:ketosteroid isomerase-like protein
MRYLLLTALIGLLGLAGSRPAVAQTEPSGYSGEEQANLELARQGVEAFMAGDVESFLTLLSEDIVWEINGSPTLVPMHGRYEGLEAVSEWIVNAGSGAEIVDFEVERYFADGDTVIMLCNERDRLLATGQEFAQRCVVLLTFNDGKLAHFLMFDDSALEFIAGHSAALASQP